MTWALASGHGNTVNKAAATTSLAHTVTTANVTAGNVGIFCVSTDNVTTTDGISNNHTSVTDSGGNAWIKLIEYTNGNGTAALGATASIWASLITSTLTSAVGVVTANFTSLTAKCVGLSSYTLAAGHTFDCRYANGAVQDASTTIASIVFSGLPGAAQLIIVNSACESTQTGFVLAQDADYTTEINNGTTGGAAGADMKILVSRRIATLTGDTHLATSALTFDSASAVAVLAEKRNVRQLTMTGVGA